MKHSPLLSSVGPWILRATGPRALRLGTRRSAKPITRTGRFRASKTPSAVQTGSADPGAHPVWHQLAEQGVGGAVEVFGYFGLACVHEIFK